MSTYKKPTDYFDAELAEMLATKISKADSSFDGDAFIDGTANGLDGKSLKQRVEWMADQMKLYLPQDYTEAVGLLMQILGPENEEETGMFTRFYWIMPIAKFVEKYGLEHFSLSMTAIREITKRNTGEYAIRPFLRKYPEQTLSRMQTWASSENFHLRRLASEGLRPKLPWAAKLDLFIDEPEPVFEILDTLKEDPIHFVKKSVANHITDYLKVNSAAANELISGWKKSSNQHTQWILKHATRKLKD